MKRLTVLFLTIILLGCSPIEQNARNAAAALQGAITTAQTQYQASCSSNSNQHVCVAINQAVAAQNALVTATEAYCGWSAVAPPTDPKAATCIPVKTAQAGLQAAIGNANLFISELKGVIK